MSSKTREAVQDALSVLRALISPGKHQLSSSHLYFQAVAAEKKLRAILALPAFSSGGELEGCLPSPAAPQESSMASQASQTVAPPVLWPAYPTQPMLNRLYELATVSNTAELVFEGDTGNWAWLLGELRDAAALAPPSGEPQTDIPLTASEASEVTKEKICLVTILPPVDNTVLLYAHTHDTANSYAVVCSSRGEAEVFAERFDGALVLPQTEGEGV